MKRSRYATLILMGAAPLLLTACDDTTPREGLYTSVAACTAQTSDEAACKASFAQASAQAEGAAPRYASQAECVAAHGDNACASRTEGSGHSFFMPMMTGFLLSQALSGGRYGAATGSPAFRDRESRWMTPGGGAGGVYNRGMTPVALKADAAPARQASTSRATTSSRGGFGASSAGRSSGG